LNEVASGGEDPLLPDDSHDVLVFSEELFEFFVNEGVMPHHILEMSLALFIILGQLGVLGLILPLGSF
jgi:hypothetical protein